MGLTRWLVPWVSQAEEWRLARYGALRQRAISAGTTELIAASGQVVHLGPPQHYADMALSRGELPTLVACLNVFARIAEGGVVWDVGGNAGFYSAIMSRIAGPEGHVFVFEPVPVTFESMCRNLEQAGARNVTPLNLALSDRDGVMPISFDPSSDTTSSLESPVGGTCVDVRVATGDTLVARGECRLPTVVKMDVEGHEVKALKGMTKVLSSDACRAVLCEVHFSVAAAKGAYRPDVDVRRLLAAAGFGVIRFISRSHLVAIKP